MVGSLPSLRQTIVQFPAPLIAASPEAVATPQPTGLNRVRQDVRHHA